jgi:glycosyltransferase involved in cell wall biosynthesis
VITRDEAPRLALALAALEDSDAEVIVVDDGSSDATRAMLDAISRPIVRVSHDTARGRSAARNAGAAVASGDVLLFLDGDVVVAPDLVRRHAEAHLAAPDTLGRGEQYHLRCTRFFIDPRTGTPMPGQEERVARMGAELTRSLVTEDQVRHDYASIIRRAEPGIYPGAGPRVLAEVELAGLRSRCDEVAWVAAAGHNFSVPRTLFVAGGGFDPAMSINEHRELALRLVACGGRMRVVDARSYHLTHRSGWRDPLDDNAWELQLWRRHPRRDVMLLAVLWRSLANDPLIPPEARLTSLDALAAAARGDIAFDYDALRRSHPKLGVLA